MKEIGYWVAAFMKAVLVLVIGIGAAIGFMEGMSWVTEHVFGLPRWSFGVLYLAAVIGFFTVLWYVHDEQKRKKKRIAEEPDDRDGV